MTIYYYTRTGRSKHIAEQLGNLHGLSVYGIEDKENWSGALNFLKAGAKSSRKETIQGEYRPQMGKKILVFPVWAGGFPPTVRDFINREGAENILLVPTSLGSKLKERSGFLAVVDLVGKEIIAPDLSEYLASSKES